MHDFAQQLVNGISLGALYALIALGYTMVYGVLRLINFAHGDVYMVGAYVGLYAASWLGLTDGQNQVSFDSVIILVPIAMLACALLGVVIERCAYKPLRKQPRLTALITAIGVSLFLEYGAQIVFGTTPQAFPRLSWHGYLAAPLNWIWRLFFHTTPNAQEGLRVFGVRIGLEDLIVVVVALVLVAVLQYIIYRTKIGKAMRAVSYDSEAASLMGINVDVVISVTFIVGSAFAGAAGVLVGLRDHQLKPLMGLNAGIKAFVAAVLGGIGSVPGALIGGLLMGLAEVAVMAWQSSLRDAIVFGILIVVLIVRPTGILGGSQQEKV